MLNQDLVRFDWEWKNGDREVARSLAKEYVEAHYHELKILENWTLEDIVKAIDLFREQGREEDRIAADAWLLAKYEPQKINGEIRIGPPASAYIQIVEDMLE